MLEPHPHPLVCVHTLAPGWTLEPGDALPDGRDLGPRGEKGWRVEWCVMHHSASARVGGKRRYLGSAPLNYARETREICDPDRQIPKPVFAQVSSLYDEIIEAGLY